MKYKKIVGTIVLASTLVLLSACQPKSLESNSYADKIEQSFTTNNAVEIDGSYPGSFLVGKEGVLPGGTSYEDRPILNVYLDPMCPGCAIFEQSVGKYLEEQVNETDLLVRYVPLMFLNEQSTDNYSSRMSAYILGVAKYEPKLIMKFMGAIFAEDFKPHEGSGYVSVTNPDIDELLKSLGGTDESIKSINAEILENETLAYATTMQVLASNRIRNASPTGQVSTPFVIPYERGKDSGTALSFTSSDMLSEVQEAVEKITK